MMPNLKLGLTYETFVYIPATVCAVPASRAQTSIGSIDWIRFAPRAFLARLIVTVIVHVTPHPCNNTLAPIYHQSMSGIRESYFVGTPGHPPYNRPPPSPWDRNRCRIRRWAKCRSERRHDRVHSHKHHSGGTLTLETMAVKS